jgi:hypothetical protein
VSQETKILRKNHVIWWRSQKEALAEAQEVVEHEIVDQKALQYVEWLGVVVHESDGIR